MCKYLKWKPDTSGLTSQPERNYRQLQHFCRRMRKYTT